MYNSFKIWIDLISGIDFDLILDSGKPLFGYIFETTLMCRVEARFSENERVYKQERDFLDTEDNWKGANIKISQFFQGGVLSMVF